MRLSWALAGWLVAAVVATLAGVAVLGLLGGVLTGSSTRPMSGDEVTAELAATTPRPAPSSATPSSGPGTTSAPGVTKVLTTKGGTIVAACSGGRATLRSWSPAQGWVTDDVDNERDEPAQVEFESGESEVKVEVRCGPDGVPFTIPR